MLLDLTRELALATPAARYDPFYGLDRPAGPSLRMLDHLTRHGDFRKYVVVLDVSAGLGGVARWLTLRYGCRVVALDPRPRIVAASARLTRRARLAGRVLGVAGVATAIAARDGVFTQIWSVEALHAHGARRPTLGELFRVLRPGSPIALQEIVRRSPGVPARRGSWEAGTLDEWRADLIAAGFHQIEHDDVTDRRAETSAIVLSARARLDERLAAGLPPDDPWHAAAAERRRMEEIVTGSDYRIVHLFAQRPSV
ncbi:MAG TPA: methyltransferase domain-containing protein [Candidatus Binatia bacterium]